MSEDKPIIIDLAKLKVFMYAQIDILSGMKAMIIENNKIILHLNTLITQNNMLITQISMNTENVIKAIQNLESASTKPDDGKTEFYE